MIIRRVVNEADLRRVTEMVYQNPSREYDCSTENYVKTLWAVHKRPWNRLWIVLEGEDAVGFLWAVADMTGLRDQVAVEALFARHKNVGVLEALLNVLGTWSYGQLKVKRIVFHSPHSERVWNRIMRRLKHGVRVKAVNFYEAEGAREWAEPRNS